MANDPYWSNTVLLLHGDVAGDPDWESAVLADGFTSAAATVPATTWNDPYGTIGQYFGKQALYCQDAPEQCYVVVLDTTGDYDALVLDRIAPVS